MRCLSMIFSFNCSPTTTIKEIYNEFMEGIKIESDDNYSVAYPFSKIARASEHPARIYGN